MSEHSFDGVSIVGSRTTLTRCLCGERLRRTANDRDDETLLVNEAMALGVVRPYSDGKFEAYFPELIAVASDPDEGWTNTFTFLDGFYSLQQVIDRHGALDPRDAAWMFRRLLIALDICASAGYHHGQPTLKHVLIHPEKHGLVLIDWTKAWAVEGVAADPDALPEPDVKQAAHTAATLLGGDVRDEGLPREYRAYFGALTAGHVTDAGEALAAFDALIEKLYGRRKFRPFSMEPA